MIVSVLRVGVTYISYLFTSSFIEPDLLISNKVESNSYLEEDCSGFEAVSYI